MQAESPADELKGSMPNRSSALAEITQHLAWALKAYGQSAIALATATTAKEVIERVCAAVVQQPIYILAFIGFVEDTPERSIKIVGGAGPALGYIDGLRLSWSEDEPEGRGPAGIAMRAGVPSCVKDSLTDPLYAPWKERGAQYGICSSVAVPFRRRDKVDGVFAVYASEVDAFGPEELELFSHLGSAIGFAYASFQDREELALERRYLSLLIASAYSGIVTADRTGSITIFNAAAERAFGYSATEALGRPIDVLFSEASSSNGVEKTGLLQEMKLPSWAADGAREAQGRKKDGTLFPIEVAVTHVDSERGVITTAIIRDLSERKILEEKLMRSARMEAIGQLASGIAHDFNNILTVILPNIRMAADTLDPTSPSRSNLELALNSGIRGADLIKRMMLFARQTQGQASVVEIGGTLANIVAILRRGLGSNIQIELQPLQQSLHIHVDPTLFETSILNLAINARDAMPNGGRIVFSIRHIGREAADGSDCDWVEITVSDNGHGIPAEMQARIFEPFFTTKEPGKGTGLGLATVKGFVEQAGGTISVVSRPDNGTTFHMRLPEVSI